MDPRAMEPFGCALLAYHNGRKDATILVRRDDGMEVPMPAGAFFRNEGQFSDAERLALKRCQGHVLDVGAGTGAFALALEKRGCAVTALDICPEAVDLMRRRGVKDIVCTDILTYRCGSFDTVMLLGHGIGMVESLDGLARFFQHARTWLGVEGFLILDSLDVRVTLDPVNLAYHEVNRAAGRYIGEIRMRFEFEGTTGPYFGWLQVDPETLAHYAEAAGWHCEVIHHDKTGEYLAELRRTEDRGG